MSEHTITPQPPVAGEVAELLEWLRSNAQTVQKASGKPANGAKQRLTRAADLLQRQHPQPVAVSERLPGPEDCDEEGRCWTTDYDPNLVCTPVWKMTELPRQDLGHNFSNAYFWRNVRFWLPANALPTPEAP